MPKSAGIAELRRKYSKGSKCEIFVRDPKERPGEFGFVEIRFSGPIADIPSLKNSKVKGTNAIRPDTKARLEIMTSLYDAARDPHMVKWESETLCCLVFCAYRQGSFDEDNVYTTVKDWLEPRVIRKKDRGWGVGVVANDRQVRGEALKRMRDTPHSKYTSIVLRPYREVFLAHEQYLNFAAGPLAVGIS